MSGAGSVEESGILQRYGQECVEPLQGPEDPKLPLSAPSGVQLAPTSTKLVEGKFCENNFALCTFSEVLHRTCTMQQIFLWGIGD
jgi:hypothetical protein